MKFLLIPLFFVMLLVNSYAFINPVLIKLMNKSKHMGSIDGGMWLADVNIVSCEAINLRIAKNKIIENEIEKFENRCDTHGFVSRLACMNVLGFMLEESLGLYDVLLDTHNQRIKFDSETIVKEIDSLVFIVAAGQVYIDFPRGERGFVLESRQLEFGITNYQKCFRDYVDLFVVKECPVETFTEIERCIDNNISHYTLKIPRHSPKRVIVRRRLGGQ